MEYKDEIERNISEKWHFLTGKTVFVAVSGGVDSMVLLSILTRLNFNVEVLHVNYQLRGQDSDFDEQCVKDFCAKNLISFHLKKVQYSEGNLQNWARKVRYEWFRSFLDVSENHFIALAHHTDDQVETFYLNLLRGGGMMGLSAMLENRNRIIRPLLHFSQNEIIEYAKRNQIKWREDISNQSLKYSRNKLRNEILPNLTTELPNLSESVLTIIDVFQRNQSDLSEKIVPIVDRLKQNEIISLNEIKKWNSFEWIEVLRQLQIPSSQLEEIKKIAYFDKGKIVKLNHSFYLALVREENGMSLRKKELHSFKLITEEVGGIPTKFNKNEIYLDRQKIVGKLSLRRWKEGDRIAPIGMKGTQLISDVIRGAKISDTEKQNCCVLEDDIQIHWLVGLKIGRNAVATPDSEILKCVVF